MDQKVNYLRDVDLSFVNEIRAARKIQKPCGNDNHEVFWKELETVLLMGEHSSPHINNWKRMENDDVVLGEVWKLPIGNYPHKHTVHKFELLYTASEDVVIDWHGHDQIVYGRIQPMKTEEWYFFLTDGSVKYCGKNEKHRLVNKYGHPIYVLSVKKCSICAFSQKLQ